MTQPFHTNTRVAWDWGSGTAEGNVREVFREKTTLTIKGARVTRNATADDPAYRIEQADGDVVLKLHSELRRAL